MALKTGDVISFERSFTIDDVDKFADISGDKGRHHVVPDDLGRVMVQGLLTATMPTKVGGDNDFLARKMTFEFIRPVFTMDTIECKIQIDEVSEEVERDAVKASFSCVNQHGKEVLRGDFSGIVKRPSGKGQ